MKPPDETSDPAADYSTANSATYNESSFDYGCPTLGTMWRYRLERCEDVPESVDLPEAERLGMFLAYIEKYTTTESPLHIQYYQCL